MTKCALVLAACAVCAPAAPPALTAQQVLDKAIQALGGRAALEKVTSRIQRGRVQSMAQGFQGTVEILAKAPDKRLVTTRIEGGGEVKRGFDGAVGWVQDPNGVRTLSGAELAALKRESAFHAELHWQKLYPKVEMGGWHKVGGRDTYAIRMYGADGGRLLRYYDAQTFLLVRSDSQQQMGKSSFVIETYLSDYRTVSGVMIPHEVRQKLPSGEVVTRFSAVLTNLPVDDKRFARPK